MGEEERKATLLFFEVLCMIFFCRVTDLQRFESLVVYLNRPSKGLHVSLFRARGLQVKHSQSKAKGWLLASTIPKIYVNVSGYCHTLKHTDAHIIYISKPMCPVLIVTYHISSLLILHFVADCPVLSAESLLQGGVCTGAAHRRAAAVLRACLS